MSPPAVDRRYTGWINPDISGSAVIRRGPSTFNLSAGTGRNKQSEEGTDTLIDRDTGEQSSSGASTTATSTSTRSAQAAGRWSEARTMRIASMRRWSPGSFDLTQDNHVTPPSGRSATTICSRTSATR